MRIGTLGTTFTRADPCDYFHGEAAGTTEKGEPDDWYIHVQDVFDELSRELAREPLSEEGEQAWTELKERNFLREGA